MDYEEFQFSNGIRLIHKNILSNVAYCGLLINTGSRDESAKQHGIAHFTEHLLFKGTKKRKYFHLLNRMEDIGGEIDAFTTKEETCISTVFTKEYYERAIELLSDIIFDSVFPDKEIKKEKQVILDEINSYKDNPAELIFDDFDEQIFKNHALSRNILGTPALLSSFTREKIIQFVSDNYNTDQIVIFSIGNIDIKKLIRICSKYFENIPVNIRTVKRDKFENYQRSERIINKKTFQSHCIMGNIAYNYYDKRKIILDLINNILGGPGMNSIFNVVLREKHGLVYNVESSYSKYTDTGLWSVYFGTDKENLDKSIELIRKELFKFKNNKMSSSKLNKAKKQVKGQLAIHADNNAGIFYTLGKSYLLYNKVDSIENINKLFDDISESQILEVSNEIFDFDKISILVYK